MKCTWCGWEYEERFIEDLDKSPLFGVPVCDRCWEAEEEAYIEVIRDLEANIDKTHRWPMYWRVLEKVAENPWEHIPLIKLTKRRKEMIKAKKEARPLGIRHQDRPRPRLEGGVKDGDHQDQQKRCHRV